MYKMLTCGSPIFFFFKLQGAYLCLFLPISKSTRGEKESRLICSSNSEMSCELFSPGNQSLKKQRGCNTKWMLVNLEGTWCFRINALCSGLVLPLVQSKWSCILITYRTCFANMFFPPTSGKQVLVGLCCIGAGLMLRKVNSLAASELGAGWARCNKLYDVLGRMSE